MDNITLPDWSHCDTKTSLGVADPLELFIYNNEPAGIDMSKQWREDLEKLVLFLGSKNPW